MYVRHVHRHLHWPAHCPDTCPCKYVHVCLCTCACTCPYTLLDIYLCTHQHLLPQACALLIPVDTCTAVPLGVEPIPCINPSLTNLVDSQSTTPAANFSAGISVIFLGQASVPPAVQHYVLLRRMHPLFAFRSGTKVKCRYIHMSM